MNIELKDLSETRKSLVVTLDKSEVDAEHQAVVGEIAKVARLPGFPPGPGAGRPDRQALRQGGARTSSRARWSGRPIAEASRRRSSRSSTSSKSKKGRSSPACPRPSPSPSTCIRQFELPEYLGLPAQVQPTEPTEAEIDAVIESLRQERADFKVAERPAQKGDYVKLAYEGTIDGKPIAELAPDKQIYGKVPQTWEEVEGEQEGLIPGLGRQLAGLKAGDKKDVPITFPADFAAVPELAGKIGGLCRRGAGGARARAAAAGCGVFQGANRWRVSTRSGAGPRRT